MIIVIFGGSGDLTRKKLIPALYLLFVKGKLPDKTVIFGIGRSDFDDESYRPKLSENIQEYDKKEEFLKSIFYFRMDQSQSKDYLLLKKRLENFAGGDQNYLFYLATPPSQYEKIPLFLKEADMEKGASVIVEKPFGYDLESAQRMNAILKSVFPEKKIYRIDHFLGKETVQNILALRFSNGIFEPLWNRNFIDRVEITAVENMGIGNRGGYYEGAGALRDMVQNHLIQLLALVAMEPPLSFNEQDFRDEVVKVYRALKPLTSDDILNNVIRGQYTGVDGINGYRDERGVSSTSMVETFLAMKLNISNWRWDGVPFYIRTGKQMPTKVTEIVVHFRPTPHRLFANREKRPEQNQLIIRIQPNEGTSLKFEMKVPGRGFDVKQVSMDFSYDKLGGIPTDDAYSRLIEDCLNSETTLFTRSDAVEASWSFFDPILKLWRENSSIPLHGYPAGTWGPLESGKIIEGTKQWTNPCKNLINSDLYCEL